MTQMAARPRRGDNTCRLNGSRDDVLYELHQYLHVPSGHPNERSRGENGFGYGLLASLWNTAESKYFSEMIVHGLQDGHFVYLSLSVGLIYSLCTGVTRTVSLSELLLESFGLFDGHALGKLFYQRRWDLIRLLQATDSNLPTIVRSFDSTAIRDIKKLLHFLAFKLAASGPTSNGERFYFIYPGANQLENALSFPLVTDSPLSMFRNTSRSAVFAIVSTRCFARTRFKCRNPVAAVDLSIEMEEDGPDAITGSAAGRQISLEHYFKGIEIGFARQYAPINQVNGDCGPLQFDRSIRYLLPDSSCLIPQENGEMKFYSEEPLIENVWPRIPCESRQRIRAKHRIDREFVDIYLLVVLII